MIFVRDILTFMGVKLVGPTPLMIDNEGMFKNIRNAVLSARNRYWAIWMNFTRECYENLITSVHLVHTDDEFADIFTKAFETLDPKYKKFRDYILNHHV